MALRESERSLRLYFFFAGAVALLLALRDLSRVSHLPRMPLDWAIALYVPIVTRCIVGGGFLVAGAKLPQQLLTGAHWIKKLLVFSAAMMFVNGALVTAIFDLDAAQAGIVGAVVGTLITIYLYRTVTRLAADAAQRAGIPAPPPEAKVV
jgi:hypothetical protein